MSEHPEDKKLRLEGQAYAKAYAGTFCASERLRMVQLIATYPDDKAHALLDELRESFWSRTWRFCPETAKGPSDAEE